MVDMIKMFQAKTDEVIKALFFNDADTLAPTKTNRASNCLKTKGEMDDFTGKDVRVM
jgi:hypothetical protein